MSHHYSGPNIGFPRGDARLDLTDLYAFPKPGDPGKSILIMNVHPSVGLNPPGPTTSEPFAPEARYELKIDTDSDAVANISYEVRPAIGLDPAPTCAVCWNQRASPQANLFRPKKGVGHFQHSAANIFVCEEIPTGDWNLLSVPSTSKKNGSLRQRAKNRWSLARVTCPSCPVETGTLSTITFPPAPVSAACAPSTQRSVAVCSPPSNDEKRAFQPNSRSCRRAERRLPRRGASGRCTFRSCLRARSGTHGRVSTGGSNAGGRTYRACSRRFSPGFPINVTL